MSMAVALRAFSCGIICCSQLLHFSLLQEEHKKAVDNIIDYAARFENAEEIDRMHETGKAKVFAVDAPDGEHDLKDLEEHAAGVNKIIDEAAFLENAEVVRKHQKMQEDTRNMVASFSSAP
uniref:Uncharacterized protein n=1 Tax=Odontella aurita TaxID=265563 RepID=A0A7S4J9E2_9STRA|mmetsp:Transcript_41942/g.127177  ORF Transcript_41942/g.127177 Transcript_41942/m.127177 type:complete len:121 (+) Transcript_41942:466-828(+)